MLIAFNKPFNVLCQFTDAAGRRLLEARGLTEEQQIELAAKHER